MKQLSPIDVTMVATRRPDLAAEVLSAFRKNLFDRIRVRRLFLNIDPLWGGEDEDAALERLVRSQFRDSDTEIEVTRPGTPSLGAAVKSLWLKPQTEWFLHMEDDWTLDVPVNVGRLQGQMRNHAVGQIRFSYWYPTKRFTRPVEFGTAPAFNRTAFARRAAELMDPALDPEKQLYNGKNPPLMAWRGKWKPDYYGTIFTPSAMTDIGKPWRLKRSIDKQVVDGISTWSSPI